MSDVHARVLQKASTILHGVENLSSALSVSRSELESWLKGDTQPPVEVFLKAIDIVAGQWVAKARSE
jgi:hypothetical protein